MVQSNILQEQLHLNAWVIFTKTKLNFIHKKINGPDTATYFCNILAIIRKCIMKIRKENSHNKIKNWNNNYLQAGMEYMLLTSNDNT